MKTTLNRLALIGITVLAFSCSTPTNPLVNKWKMVKVMEKDTDITDKLNPNNDRWITFKADNSFESDGTPYGHNTGTYTIDEENAMLSLISDAGEGDNSQWRVSYANDSMVWKGIGTERQESTLIRYVKMPE